MRRNGGRGEQQRRKLTEGAWRLTARQASATPCTGVRIPLSARVRRVVAKTVARLPRRADLKDVEAMMTPLSTVYVPWQVSTGAVGLLRGEPGGDHIS